MGIIATQQQLPPPQTPLVNAQGQTATKDLRFLLLALLNRTGGAAGAPSIDAGAVVTAGTPYLITSDWTQFATVPAGQVAQLPAMGAGTDAIIFNDGANSIDVNPATGIEIDGSPSRYTLVSGKMQWFRCVTPTLIKSMQLG